MRCLLKLLCGVLIAFFGSTILAVLVFKWTPVPITPLMVIRLGEQMSDGKSFRLAHDWVPLSEMSDQLPIAVMASEDQLFREHHGFDFKQIKMAIDEHEAGGRSRGASTISQQTAKNVFLWPGHSWIRKGLEAYFTVLIETLWGKDRIMEVYLNSIEMGDGIYGAEAVAQEHFGCSATQLSRQQCALIAATLPNPLKFDSAHPSRYILRRQNQILRQMRYVERALQRTE